MSPLPVRVETKASWRHRANTSGRDSSAGCETRRCASPPLRRSHPDIATGNEGDLGPRGAKRGLGEVRRACGAGEDGDERESGQNSHD